MPEFQPAQDLRAFACEILDLSKSVWASQSTDKPPVDLTETEFLALDTLSRAEHPLNVGDIQREIRVAPAQMSRILRSLESKGEKLVECKLNHDDKRRIDVELTPSGREVHQKYRQVKLATIQKMLDGFTVEERNQFMILLRKIRDNLHKSTQRSS